MVAFIIFGGFALVRCIGRVFLIPVLSARSASHGDLLPDWHGCLCHGAGRTECISSPCCLSKSFTYFATALAARSASLDAQHDHEHRVLCLGAGRTECIAASDGDGDLIRLCHGAGRTECIPQSGGGKPAALPLPRRWPHGVHLQKQTNFVCIMRRELVDSFSETTRSGSCADYFPILFCCQSDLYHHDRQPRTGNRPVLLCEQHSHFLCIRPSH